MSEQPTATTAKTAKTAKARGTRQVKVGTVVSNKMKDTVVVAVERPVMNRLYQRFVRRTTRFHAHDKGNRCQIGDRVEIVSTRPLSKTKRWAVREVLKRAEES